MSSNDETYEYFWVDITEEGADGNGRERERERRKCWVVGSLRRL